MRPFQFSNKRIDPHARRRANLYPTRVFPAICLAIVLVWVFHPWQVDRLFAGKADRLQALIGNQDAVHVTDPQGNVFFSKNADKKLVPASTLKIFTALAALHYLGQDYQFATDFYLDKDSNLKVKGYGDPLLISEVLSEMSHLLGARIKEYNDLVLDDSYFENPIVIPGTSSSSEPYDAPNGALCANFNTVNFKKTNGAITSAEPQTPLLPFALSELNTASRRGGRIILSHNKNEYTLYAGHLLEYFLNKAGIKSNGTVRLGQIHAENDTLLFRYASPYCLAQVISKLFEYSNNFMANQILISTGAHVYGPPGTLAKGILAASTFAKEVLKIGDIDMVEGSGISRGNRMSAKALDAVLEKFEPHHLLMRRTGREFYKTGTLDGIMTRAGYIETGNGELFRFVVFINTPGKSPKGVMNRLLEILD